MPQDNMSTPLSDIWQRVLDGDDQGWNELVAQYANLVYSVARRNGLDKLDAADCVQQTWMALYKSRRSIRDADNLPGWLTGTAYRRAMRIVNKRAASKRTEQKTPVPDPPLTPEEHLALLQRRVALRQAIARLDDDCATLLEAMFLGPEGRSYRDIARKLALSFNSLGPRRQRCLAKLKKILSEMGLF